MMQLLGKASGLRPGRNRLRCAGRGARRAGASGGLNGRLSNRLKHFAVSRPCSTRRCAGAQQVRYEQQGQQDAGQQVSHRAPSRKVFTSGVIQTQPAKAKQAKGRQQSRPLRTFSRLTHPARIWTAHTAPTRPSIERKLSAWPAATEVRKPLGRDQGMSQSRRICSAPGASNKPVVSSANKVTYKTDRKWRG
jgi:hypothetical protein